MMKPKVSNKRLVLNKKSIANLSKTVMGVMYGGVNNVPSIFPCQPQPPQTIVFGCDSEAATICVVCFPDKT